jgi:hypothetical protein
LLLKIIRGQSAWNTLLSQVAAVAATTSVRVVVLVVIAQIL